MIEARSQIGSYAQIWGEAGPVFPSLWPRHAPTARTAAGLRHAVERSARWHARSDHRGRRHTQGCQRAAACGCTQTPEAGCDRQQRLVVCHGLMGATLSQICSPLPEPVCAVPRCLCATYSATVPSGWMRRTGST